MKTTRTRNRVAAAAIVFCVAAAAQFTSVARAQTQSDGATSSEHKKTPTFTEKPAAQDTPVGVVGAEVATQETPAAATNSDALRNAAQNPIASLVSVPVQNIDNFNIGPANRTQNIVNIQPVIPLSLSANWNLVVRWIMPILYQPIPVPQPPGAPAQTTGVNGLGDMNPSFFLVPKKTSKIIWGIGPTVVLPTATNTAFLGQGKLSIGPSVVVLVQPKPWTIGFLTNNYWSVAGHSDNDKPAVNQFLLQWFVNYNLKKGWYLTTAPIITANWRASSPWVVPFGGGVGRIMKMGFQPVNISVQFYGNAVHPPGASPWALKLQIAFLFPKLSPEQKKMLLQKALEQMDQQTAPKP
ncbi:MAG: hypothetical protein WA639_00580 [Candidatus Acidiferrum sp.]